MLGISHRGISSKHTYDIQKSTFEVEAAGIKLFRIEQILEVQATIGGGARGRQKYWTLYLFFTTIEVNLPIKLEILRITKLETRLIGKSH